MFLYLYASLLFVFYPRFSHCWTTLVHSPSPSRRYAPKTLYHTNNNNQDDEGNNFFDDFDGQIIGGEQERKGSSSRNRDQSTTTLQQRMQIIQQQQVQKDARTVRNWKTGNWNVRGFSFDLYDTNNDHRVFVTKIIPASNDFNDSCIWVGRTDGSILQVQLGKQYWAIFRSEQQEEEEVSVRDNEWSSDDNNDHNADDDNDEPFQIQQQFTTGMNSPIMHMVEYNEQYLFTVTMQSHAPCIQQWLLHDDEDSERSPVLYKTFPGIHSTNIVTMQVLPKTSILFTAAQDGSIAFWNVETGDMIYHCTIKEGWDVTCADTDGHSIYLGTTNGIVVAYQVRHLLDMVTTTGQDTCPVPHGQWTACDNGAVTSISCGGLGTLGRGRDQPTYLLLTGDENGLIKQWEIISRKVESSPRLEQWPKLSTQRLAKKAHVFRGHHGAVSALQAVDATKFVSSGLDGTVRAWNPISGQQLFLMDGFDDPVQSLCFVEELLITDGMRNFVCVHDFGINSEEENNGTDFYLDSL